MDTNKTIETLITHGYSLALIAKVCNIRYMRLYRAYAGIGSLEPGDAERIRVFALAQPCFSQEGDTDGL